MCIPIIVLLLVGATIPLQAQPSFDELADRREAVAERMGEGVLLAFGAPNPVGTYPFFSQLPAFRYLTSFLEPDAALLMVVREDTTEALLFTKPISVRQAFYDGFRMDAAAVRARTGLEVREMAGLRPLLDSLLASGLPLYTLRDFASVDHARADTLTRGRAFVAELAARHPALTVRDAHPIVDSLRARKSAYELALLQRAIDLTVEAHEEVMKQIEPGMHEYEVQALIEYVFRRGGAERPAFTSIVGSGINSTVLHYGANTRQMQAGDVVVMDVGALFDGYAADVTRTVPVNGRFTPEQRALYQIVRDAQAAAERVVRPGTTGRAWAEAAEEVVAGGLAELGLVEAADAEFDPPWAELCERRPFACRQAALFYPHGLGHGIGLEVHDPMQLRFGERVFQPGDVFTIEPGIYVNVGLLELLPDTPRNRAMIERIRPTMERYHGIGIRIEDDYVVTEEGVEWLSPAPREIPEIEALMSE